MSQYDTEAAFNKFQRQVQRCIEEGVGRISALGGRFTIAMRVKPSGDLKWAFLEESTLGDRRTERCVLSAARDKTWPQPKGGEGEARHTFTFDGMVDVHTWDGERMRTVMTTIMKKMWKCIEGVRGRWSATVYVGPDGRVMSAGIAPPSAKAEDKSDCVVGVLETFNFGRQRRRVSKVTFAIGY